MKKLLYQNIFVFVMICNLQLCQAASLIPKRHGNNQLSSTIEVDVGQKRRITEINKDNFLHGGDILEKVARNGLVDANTRWSKTIPFQFNEQLSLLAIASILDGFEDLELKTCFGFVNRSTETDYIAVAPLDGCFSYVGRQGGPQTLSIGSGCERIDVVQHEVLHALGLFHEQSRPDRDDYVTVQLQNVLQEYHHAFNKYESNFVDPQRVPYDYYSVMHYDRNAFSANGLPSIVTHNPHFQNVIGTGQALSSGDLTKLRRMYDCGDTHRYSYFCDFEDLSICGYVPLSTGWKRHSVFYMISPNSPQTDATFGTTGRGNILIASSSSFSPSIMWVRTPLLESTVGKQCLTFSYYMRSTSVATALSVTLESNDINDRRTVLTLSGDQGKLWRKARATISATSEFKLLFTARAGSMDVVAIDDVNVIDRSCETGFFTLERFSETLSTSSSGDVVRSPIMYTDDGYAFRISVYPVGVSEAPDTSSMSVFFNIAQGVNDDQLEWPFQNRYIKLSLLDQTPDVLQQSNVVSNFLTDSAAYWEKPTGSLNTGLGYRHFVKVDDVRNMRSYLKHDSIIVSVQVTDMNDWAHLQASQTAAATTTTTAEVATIALTNMPTTAAPTNTISMTPDITTNLPETTNSESASLRPKRQERERQTFQEEYNSISNTIGIDASKKRRIPEINKDNVLHGGDIIQTTARNGLVDESMRWSKIIPFQLSDKLSLLTIAVILEGFEDLELKTCFGFVNRSTEIDYIAVKPLDGCFSYVGRQGGSQNLSIGLGCEYIDTVQHEVLHALGLFHEQSRSDRDDYVTVLLQNVLEEQQHNFDKYESNIVDHRRVPYDYYSILHYDGSALSTNGFPSIVTHNPDFQNVIGTGQTLSSGDLTKLRRMYDCGDTHRYSYFCDFEDVSVCGYVPQGTGWTRQSVSASALPHTDATFGETGTGNILVAISPNPSHSTMWVRTPLLESTVSKQCLEFSYYMRSSSAAITLSVTWESTDSKVFGKMFTFNGDQKKIWRKARMTMSAPSKFKLLFTATAGSLDVVAIDDVNVIDRPCETGFFVLEDISQTLSTFNRGDFIRSPIMYTDDGYAFQLSVYPVGDSGAPDTSYMSVFFNIARGVNDDQLEWPFRNRYIKFSLVDQTPDVLQQSNVVSKFLTDSAAYWGKPTGSSNTGLGYRRFVKVDDVRNLRSYLKHDSIIISVQVTDMNIWSHLQTGQATRLNYRQYLWAVALVSLIYVK